MIESRNVRPWMASAVRAALTLAAIACAGCQLPGARLAPAEEADLERRAMDLLIRAVQSDKDVLRANAMEALVKVDAEVGKPYFRTSLDAPNAMVRYAACVSLGEIRDAFSLNALRRRLSDPDPRVRIAAAFAVYRCGDVNAGKELLDALRDSPDERMRADAAYLIGRLGDAKALRALQRALDRETSSYVVVHIETAMALLGDDAKVDKLIAYMLKSDSVTRLLAIQGLAELQDERARDALAYRVNDDSDYLQTRLLAARGLGRLGRNTGYRLAYSTLTAVSQDVHEQMRIRSNAALALGAIGDRRALAALRDRAANDSDERVQVAAAYAILMVLRHDSAHTP